MTTHRPDRATPRRRRVSRRRYLVRRAAVVAVIVGGGFGVVRVAGALGGEDDQAADVVDITAAPTTTTRAVPLTEVTADTSDEFEAGDPEDVEDETPTGRTDAPTTRASTVATTTTLAPETTPATTVPAPPTADDPAKVLVVGDSFAGLWGPPLESTLEETGVVEVEIDYLMGSGLGQPRDFDWFATCQRAAARRRARRRRHLVRRQRLRPADRRRRLAVVGDPVNNEEEWIAEYQERAGAMMDLLSADGRTVVWVGIPNDSDPAQTAGLAIQNEAAKAAAAERPHIVFIDGWGIFSGRDGNWAEYVIDPRDGLGKDVRMDDGYHINDAGAEIIAHYAAEAVGAAIHL